MAWALHKDKLSDPSFLVTWYHTFRLGARLLPGHPLTLPLTLLVTVPVVLIPLAAMTIAVVFLFFRACILGSERVRSQDRLLSIRSMVPYPVVAAVAVTTSTTPALGSDPCGVAQSVVHRIVVGMVRNGRQSVIVFILVLVRREKRGVGG